MKHDRAILIIEDMIALRLINKAGHSYEVAYRAQGRFFDGEFEAEDVFNHRANEYNQILKEVSVLEEVLEKLRADNS